MIKRVVYVGLGLVLAGFLLFGSRAWPYAQTAYKKVREAAQQSVPISMQIETARDQLKKIDPEVKNMVMQIAREKATIKRLERDIEAQTAALNKRQDEILALRAHLESGDEVFVASNGRSYTTQRVEEDLRNRFNLYRTAEQTRDKSVQILEARQKSLEAALAKLETAQVLQRELETQIENLTARERMLDVAKTSSSINLDNSQLARTKKLIEEISATMDAEEEMLELVPKYFGEIPVEHSVPVGDIRDEIDSYFGQGTNSKFVRK